MNLGSVGAVTAIDSTALSNSGFFQRYARTAGCPVATAYRLCRKFSVVYGSRTLPPGMSNQASISPCGMMVEAFDGDLNVVSKPPLRSCSTITGAMSVKNGGAAISVMLNWSAPGLAQNPSEFFAKPFDSMIWA